MEKIGQYDYPDLTTFTETFEIAKECLNRYGGFMTNVSITTKLGYTFKNANQISGWIYKRFDDMEGFGLFVRERGGVRATPLGKEATDPYDSEKSREGKKKSIYKFPLLKKAAEEWNLVIPDQDAFPAKLADLASVDWVEAKKHSETLQKLISDCFMHLRPSIDIGETKILLPMPEDRRELQPLGDTRTGGRAGIGVSGTVVVTNPFGELRTLVGTVVIKNLATLNLARNTLDVLEDEIKEREAEAKRSAKQKEEKE